MTHYMYLSSPCTLLVPFWLPDYVPHDIPRNRHETLELFAVSYVL